MVDPHRSAAARRAAKTRGNRTAYVALWSSLAPTRVSGCASCGAAALWKGYLHALRTGWAWRLEKRRLVWRCGTCVAIDAGDAALVKKTGGARRALRQRLGNAPEGAGEERS